MKLKTSPSNSLERLDYFQKESFAYKSILVYSEDSAQHIEQSPHFDRGDCRRRPKTSLLFYNKIHSAIEKRKYQTIVAMNTSLSCVPI